MRAPPAFITPATVSEDKLTAIRAKAAEARDLELRLEDLEAEVEETRAALNELKTKTLPDMMSEAQIDTIGLPADGNFPAYDLKLGPFYAANIAASWPPERKAEAFAYLESLGEGDLIKTEVGIAFAREQREEAKALADRLVAENLNPTVKETVAAQTLSAWLKNQVENHGVIPDLSKIGGTIGKTVKLKERKT